MLLQSAVLQKLIVIGEAAKLERRSESRGDVERL